MDLLSGTPPIETLKFLLAYCAKGQNAHEPLRIGVFDISRAYFYAPCKRPLYIEIPPEDWEEGDERLYQEEGVPRFVYRRQVH